MVYRSTIHQSLTRPMLLAGAERAPAVANWIMAACILFGGGLHWYTIAANALLVTLGHWALMQAAKFDPELSRVYLRHMRYQRVYAARPSIAASSPRVRPSVPTVREIRRKRSSHHVDA